MAGLKSSNAEPLPRGQVASGRAIALLLASGVLLACSLLVVVPAPTNWLWIAAILIGEWGHWAVVACLLVAFVGFRRGGRVCLVSAGLAVLSAILCCSPTARAIVIARSLPARCTAAFGKSGGASRAPLKFLDLFRGIGSGPVDVTEHVYAADGTKELRLDLYRAKRDGRSEPLIVVVHGGSWKGGNKQQLPAWNRCLANQGYAVAAINYRHTPKWPFPAAVNDVFRAIDYLRSHAAELAIDSNRIVLIGRSAGGQLALSAAYSQRDPAIRGVVAFYAPTDLVLGYAKPSAPAVLDSRRVLREYLGGTPAEKPDLYAAASPINFVTSATPPTLLIHGALDPMVWSAHSENLSARLENATRPHLYVALPWGTHGCDANLAGPSGQLSLYAIERFLAAALDH